MKGLLLKDFYMVMKYCRSILAIVIIFSICAVLSVDNVFMLFYPVLITGLIPMTLLSYEEKCKWSLYSGTLPYSRGQLVSSKYILVAVMVAVEVVLIVCCQCAGILIGNGRMLADIAGLSAMLGIVGLMAPAVLLPFIFKYGTEKGRMAYYMIIGAFCALAAVAAIEEIPMPFWLTGAVGDLAALLIAFMIFMLSWQLSIRFYERRELA